MRRLILLLAVYLLAASASGRTISVAGSDFLPDSLIEALQTFAESRNDELDLNLRGSLLAFREFDRGDADLILVAIPPKEKEEYLFPTLPFGFQVGTLIVNRRNPLEEITASQIGGVFGSPSENPITRWSELGLSGAWDRRIIQPGYADEPGNPVSDMFSAYFLENEPVREAIQSYQTSIRLEAVVSNNDDSIGLMAGLPLGSDVKTLRIADSNDGVSFGPTMENVNFGDYPLTLPYYACVPRSQHRLLSPYLEFLLSDKVAEILQKEGFFSLIRSRRLQLTSALPSE